MQMAKKIILLMAVIMLSVSILIALSSSPELKDLMRILITSFFCWFLFKGRNWARKSVIVFTCLGGIVAVFMLIRYQLEFEQEWQLYVLVIIYFGIAAVLSFSKTLTEYFSGTTFFDLKNYNTLAVPAKAKNLVVLNDASELSTLFNNIKQSGNPALMLGSGSNVLFVDDFPGTVIVNKITGIAVTHEDDFHVYVSVGAGEIWHDFVLKMLARGWFGLENLSLIPGTVGAAPVQNIGAYGVEVGELIEKVLVYDVENKRMSVMNHKECLFSYRDSFFKAQNQQKLSFVITQVHFKLCKSSAKSYSVNLRYKALLDAFYAQGIENPSPLDVANMVIKIRQSKLPDPNVIPNAGSFFKNPIVSNEQYQDLLVNCPELTRFGCDAAHVKLAAGQLIELSGFKGKQIGNVAMHHAQALVLTNCGGATGREILEYARTVQTAVLSKFCVKIEPEPLILMREHL